MKPSPFTFFRGTAALQAQDLSTTPNSGLTAQLCGDAHLANFGLFAGRARQPIFDLNDFDETNPGPFEWDVKRLAASLALAARDIGADTAAQEAMVREAVGTYRQSMHLFATMNEIDLWYYRIDNTRIHQWSRTMSTDLKRTVKQGLTNAPKRDSWSALSKLTELRNGTRQFKSMPPLLTPIPHGHRAVIESLYARYLNSLDPEQTLLLSRYTVTDVAFKVVGVGSVGLFAVAALLQGRDENDLLALQMKEARESVLEPYTEPSIYKNHGQRVVVGQSLIQADGDPLLGWLEGLHGREHYVRQLRDMKWSPRLDKLSPGALLRYAQGCSHTLARAHARTGDSLAIASYMGTSNTFDQAIADYAIAYTPRVDDYYADFLASLKTQDAATQDTDLAAWWETQLPK